MNEFITSHFSYFPVVWMFHNRKLNDRINKLQKRAVRIGYRGRKSIFCELFFR